MVNATGLAIGELVVRAACAGIFFWAGLAKVTDGGFAVAVARLTKLPTGASAVVARLIPPLELLVAVGLVMSPATQIAAILGLILLGSFTALLIWHLMTGTRDACACFGTRGSAPISWFDVVRNVQWRSRSSPQPSGTARSSLKLLG